MAARCHAARIVAITYAPGGQRDRDDAAAVSHEASGLADPNEERLGLRVHRVIPGLQRDLHRLLVELRRLRARVGDEDVERSEVLPDLAEHSRHVFDS